MISNFLSPFSEISVVMALAIREGELSDLPQSVKDSSFFLHSVLVDSDLIRAQETIPAVLLPS